MYSRGMATFIKKNLEHQEFQSNVTLHFKFLQDAFRSSKIKINKSLDTQSILRLQTVKLLKILAQELYGYISPWKKYELTLFNILYTC